MTQEERQMLTDLANKIASTPAPAHDAEAEELIRTKIGSRPDALYLMTQTVLIQNLAIEHAKQQIQELQQKRAQQPQAATQVPSYAPPPPQSYVPPPPPQPAYAPPPQGGGSSFLRSAATTAAGVAAGALAFEGIRSLFGGAEHLMGFGSGGGMQGSSFLGGAPGSETVINNYYDSPERSGRDEASYEDPDRQAGNDREGDDDLQASGDDSTQSADSADTTDNSGSDSGSGSSGSDSA